jgi:hypothetical protein
LLGAIFRTIIVGLSDTPTPSYRRGLLVGLLGSFLVLTIHSLFDNLLVHGMQVQVGLLMGLAIVAAEPPPIPDRS